MPCANRHVDDAGTSFIRFAAAARHAHRVAAATPLFRAIRHYRYAATAAAAAASSARRLFRAAAACRQPRRHAVVILLRHFIGQHAR